MANAMRSPTAPDRDPGMIVPTYTELAKNAHPMISYSTYEGDDMITCTTADRSLRVNAAAALGEIDTFAPVIAAAIGGFATAMNHGGDFHMPPPPPPAGGPGAPAHQPNFMLVPAAG